MPSVEVGGARIAWSATGPVGAPALVFSNSLGTAAALWDDVAGLVGGRRLIRYDTRGHGASEAPGGDYRIDQLGIDLLAVLDAAQVQRATICGISLGGLTALWLAIHAPERVHRLVLANTGAVIGTLELWNHRIQAVRAQGMAPIVEGLLGRWFTPPFHESEPARVDRFRRMLLAQDPVGYAGCAAAVRDADFRHDLGTISTPTLVIAGDRDIATPLALSETLVAGIPGARLEVLQAAHLSCVEQAEPFARLLLDPPQR